MQHPIHSVSGTTQTLSAHTVRPLATLSAHSPLPARPLSPGPPAACLSPARMVWLGWLARAWLAWPRLGPAGLAGLGLAGLAGAWLACPGLRLAGLGQALGSLEWTMRCREFNVKNGADQ